MNKTRKLTQGAMLLAIVGALMVIDRQIGFWFSLVISMMFAVVVIIYSTMYEIKDGIVIGIALGVLTFLLGDPEITYVYYPISFITGVIYSYGLKKDWNRSILIAVSIVTFIVGEIIVALVINPLLFNLPIQAQLQSLQEITDELLSTYKSNPQIAPVAQEMSKYITGLLPAMFILTIVIAGLSEGILVHLMSVLLLKKFRIKEIQIKSALDTKPNKVLSYTCMLTLLALFIITRKVQLSETFNYVSIVLSMFSIGYLAWKGYIYACLYTRVTTRRNFSFLIILAFVFFTPVVLPALVIIGFLYGAGPLYDKLMEKINYEKNNNI